MKILATIILSLSFIVSHGEIVKLKFQLLNKLDSSLIGLDKVEIIPIKSYLVDEIEHHNKKVKIHNFKNYKFYYDKESHCNVFEFNSTEYPYNDIYLKINSDSFYYYRPFESDYDIANSIHLKADENKKIHKIILSPYRFVNMYYGKLSKITNDCININLNIIFGDDSIQTKSEITRINLIAPDSLIKTYALNASHYLLFVEIYNNGKYKYSYYDLNTSNKIIQNIALSDLNYIDYWENLPDCVKSQTIDNLTKFVEYYNNE